MSSEFLDGLTMGIGIMLFLNFLVSIAFSRQRNHPTRTAMKESERR